MNSHPGATPCTCLRCGVLHAQPDGFCEPCHNATLSGQTTFYCRYCGAESHAAGATVAHEQACLGPGSPRRFAMHAEWRADELRKAVRDDERAEEARR